MFIINTVYGKYNYLTVGNNAFGIIEKKICYTPKCHAFFSDLIISYMQVKIIAANILSKE